MQSALVGKARGAMIKPGRTALLRRQRVLLGKALDALVSCQATTELLLVAEELRQARLAFDALTGRAATEDMLDSLFGRFCIGK